jgi:hypothetical protein
MILDFVLRLGELPDYPRANLFKAAESDPALRFGVDSVTRRCVAGMSYLWGTSDVSGNP